MFTILSIVTSVKDYIEIVHKLIEHDTTFDIANYYDVGGILTYIVLCCKQFIFDLFSFQWLQGIWSIPVLIPDIASAMVSEISVLDGYFHNALTFLETPISYGDKNFLLYCLEKFSIGLINSIFLCLPTSAAHIITIRRFVMQGLEAGYISGLGTISGNLLWLASIIFGWRFLMIPWLSMDILRYSLGFILLIKYMWDSYNERKMVLEDISKYKIFLLNFLLAFTEQTSIFPFLSNLSIGSETTILENFPTNNFGEFSLIHCCYLFGIVLGSLSLLYFSCWFWENPAFNLYMWVISSFKVSTESYYKFLNFGFLYLTMICTISSIPYFGLDYTITNPLGLVHNDRLIDQKTLVETSFLNTKASDRNTRRNRGRHGRRERWKRRIRRYRTFDASLYDQGVYDLFTIEDLNYGFDRFWLRRKMRNHRFRFRLFPGPWARSLKKQMGGSKLESYMGPRVDFFRILFQLANHPSFASGTNNESNKNFNNKNALEKTVGKTEILNTLDNSQKLSNKQVSLYSEISLKNRQKNLVHEFSTLRKFVRKINRKLNTSKIAAGIIGLEYSKTMNTNKSIYSKRWKQIFSKISHNLEHKQEKIDKNLYRKLYKELLQKNSTNQQEAIYKLDLHSGISTFNQMNLNNSNSTKMDVEKRFAQRDNQILKYRNFLSKNKLENRKLLHPESKNDANFSQTEIYKPLTLLHPIKFYLDKEKAFQRKLKFYGSNIFRSFQIENNAPYFRVMMRRYFYNYKPTSRWERTLKTATLRKALRKGPRTPRNLNLDRKTKAFLSVDTIEDKASVSYNPTANTTAITARTLAAVTETPLKRSGALAGLAEDSTTSSQYTPYSDTSVSVLRDNNNSSNTLKVTLPTHMYSLVDKRTTRHRYQIYKDVLQHWYYSPINRLLVKFDIDSFIRRQPINHFLTKKEEKLLHLRRFLLSDYYDTLRWYTFMENYKSMKAKIGGTKSFASRTYNQQFQGTFKKIRHLFSITPSLGDNNVLKFDQPLFNEYSATKNTFYTMPNSHLLTSNQTLPPLQHEELLNTTRVEEQTENTTLAIKQPINSKLPDNNLVDRLPEDLPNQSTRIIREYLIQSSPIRQEIIKKLILDKNYWELSNFLLKGQKIRGIEATTNPQSFLKQEKNLLYTVDEKTQWENLEKQKLKNLIKTEKIQQNLWIALLKRSQNNVYNTESIRNYLSRKVDKREKRKQLQVKQLKERIQRIQNLFTINTNESRNTTLSLNNSQNTKKIIKVVNTETLNNRNFSSAIKKAMKEAINLQKTTNRKDKFKLGFYKNSLKNKKQIQARLYKRLENVKILSTQSEQKLGQTLDSINSLVEKQNQLNKNWFERKINYILTTVNQIIRPIKNTSLLNYKKQTGEVSPKTQANKLNIFKYLFNKKPNKTLNDWRAKQQILNRRKKTRKSLKRFSKEIKIDTNNIMQNLEETFKLEKATDGLNSNQRSVINQKFVQKNKTNYNSNFKMFNLSNHNLRKKPDLEENWTKLESQRNTVSWKNSLPKLRELDFDAMNKTKENSKKSNSGEYTSFSTFSKIKTQITNLIKKRGTLLGLNKKFRRKKNRRQTYANLRMIKYGSAYSIKKPNLLDTKQRQIRNIELDYSKNKSINIKDKLLGIFKNDSNELTNEFIPSSLKTRRPRERETRFWKKHRRRQAARNRQKFRKRKRYAKGKIKMLSKKMNRIRNNLEIKKWWWENYLPNFQATTNALWQLETDQQLRQKLEQLSTKEIINLDNERLQRLSANELFGEMNLQIGNKDFKPLSTPQALRLHEQLFNNPTPGTDNVTKDQNTNAKDAVSTTKVSNPITAKLGENLPQDSPSNTNMSVLDTLALNLLKNQINPQLENSNFTKFMAATNPLPFYAGWDESLRKFVITNRLLSRTTAGYEMNFNPEDSLSPNLPRISPQLDKVASKLNSSNLTFSNFPLKGMNAATTLYWQIPFTTYDPDQFFALGLDGFAPIGWRRFTFRHNLQTTLPLIVKNKLLSYNKETSLATDVNQLSTNSLNYKLKMKILNNNPDTKVSLFQSSSNVETNTEKTLQRKLAYRNYRRVQHMKKLQHRYVRNPSGPLANQVLPVHYIYIFYKRYRLPRDRFLITPFQRESKILPLSSSNVRTRFMDLTLRRRVKPRRQYHRKRFLKKRGLSSPRRTKFYSLFNINMTRPFSKGNIQAQNQPLLKKKLKRRQKSDLQAKTSRIRQLRQRILRQVLRPTWRYKPRAGGIVWPGDYLQLELTQSPKLKSSNFNIVTPTGFEQNLQEGESNTISPVSRQKTRKKKKRNIQQWQVQPKKYLIQKHNLKVLKKRLEKAQGLDKIQKKK